MPIHPLVDALALTLSVTETPLARAAAIDGLQALIVTAPDSDLRAIGLSLIELAFVLDTKGATHESRRVMGLLAGIGPRLGSVLTAAADDRMTKARKSAASSRTPGASALTPAGRAGVKVRKS